jgi:hypothetical protein
VSLVQRNALRQETKYANCATREQLKGAGWSRSLFGAVAFPAILGELGFLARNLNHRTTKRD